MDSSVPAAVNQLITDLKAAVVGLNAPDGSATQVFDGPVPTYEPEQYVMVRGVTGALQMPQELGNLARNEVYDIDCMLRAYVGGEQAEMTTVRTNAFALFTAIENTLTNDWPLGQAPVGMGTVVRFAQVHAFDFYEDTTAVGGRAGQIDFKVRCEKTLRRGAGN